MKSRKPMIVVAAVILLLTMSFMGCKGAAETEAKSLKLTATDWEQADEAEKEQVAVEYAKRTAALAGIEDGEEQAENMSSSDIQTIMDALDALFEARPEESLEELIEEVMGDMK